MKIRFVRHGETDWNVQKRIQGGTDIELNETGMEQAKQLGQTIAEQKLEIAKIYTSKLQRAYKTAQIIGECIHKEVIPMDGLEEIHFGQWEGMRWSEVKEQFPLQYQVWNENRRYEKAPEGETYQELMERVLNALRKIIQENEQDVLVVTHSADIVTLLAMIHYTPFSVMFEQYKIGNAKVIEIDRDDLLAIDLTESFEK